MASGDESDESVDEQTERTKKKINVSLKVNQTFSFRCLSYLSAIFRNEEHKKDQHKRTERTSCLALSRRLRRRGSCRAGVRCGEVVDEAINKSLNNKLKKENSLTLRRAVALCVRVKYDPRSWSWSDRPFCSGESIKDGGRMASTSL